MRLLQTYGVEILDSIYDGLLIADAQGVVVYVNTEYTRITGAAPGDIIGKMLTSVRKGATLPEVIRSGQRRSGVYRRNGDVEYVVDMAPIVIDGKIRGGISIVKDITEIQHLNSEIEKLKNYNTKLRRNIGRIHSARYSFSDIISRSPVMEDLVRKAKKMAVSNADILLIGESGTGKEVLAQSIHNSSMRAEKPFLAINCATLSSDLAESELFGYVEGAFTGAARGGKIGIFEVANGGTLFLDEIDAARWLCCVLSCGKGEPCRK